MISECACMQYFLNSNKIVVCLKVQSQPVYRENFFLCLPHQGVGEHLRAIHRFSGQARHYPRSRQESSGPPITSPTIGPATMASGPEPIVAHTDRLISPLLRRGNGLSVFQLNTHPHPVEDAGLRCHNVCNCNTLEALQMCIYRK